MRDGFCLWYGENFGLKGLRFRHWELVVMSIREDEDAMWLTCPPLPFYALEVLKSSGTSSEERIF